MGVSPMTDLDWNQLLFSALDQVASTALGGPAAALGDAGPISHTATGAYVPLITAIGGLQLGLVAGDPALAALASALLGLPPEDLTPADIADALAEIANMFAGCAKTLLLATVAPVTIGLPVVVHGWIDPGERLAVRAQRVNCVGHDVSLVLIASRGLVG
jgi:hypothetical protein